jgi:hypothetical protein
MGRPTTVVVMLPAWNNVTNEESAVGRLSINIIDFIYLYYFFTSTKYFYIYSSLEKVPMGDMESTLCLWDAIPRQSVASYTRLKTL